MKAVVQTAIAMLWKKSIILFGNRQILDKKTGTITKKERYHQHMELEYTYFEAEDGFFVGWFDRFPEDVTQGETLEELEEMLADMYKCLCLAKYHKRKLVLA